MKEQYIAQLQANEEITDFFLVKTVAIKMGSNRKQYLDILLGDKSGEAYGKKWDISDNEFEGLGKINPGDIIKVKAVVTEWNGAKQLKIFKIRHTGPEDEIEKADFFKAAPEAPEDMYAYIFQRADDMTDPHFSMLAKRLLTDNKDRLMYWPAAARNHHAEYAGLLYHVKRMLMVAERICEIYTNLNKDLLLVGVIVHDIEKLNEMNSDENGIVSEYTFDGIMLGHLIQGIVTIDKLSEELGIPHEKKIMLEHMILSHHYEPEYGSPKRPLFPEAEALHYLDMLDSKMFDMEEALFGAEVGSFSDRIWTLDNRRVYKRNW
ncbi:MAG: HD domain-containing protein [Clostridiales Family XIII bacterium]|jgi:3'-5' exoribonuclease|nr:HD domain-containing protein [Clostridiales Family XIII bacterium]